MNEHLTYKSEIEYWKDVYKGKIKFASKNNSSVIPWDIKCVDPNLPDVLDYYSLYNGKILEIGCGTGYDARFLKERGFDVSAIDISEEVINEAKKNHAGVDINFITGDFFTDISNEKFDIIYDRGFLHNYDGMLLEIFNRVSNLLNPQGKYIFITGNPNQPPIQTCTPPPIFIGQVEYYSSRWFKIIMSKEIIFKTEEDYNDCLGYIFYLEKR